MKLTVIILTYNEEIHLERCLKSVLQLTPHVVVADCFSTDTTVKIAQTFGATVLQRAWDGSHSTQVNWALDQITNLPYETQWVMRVDADEILSQKLIDQIHHAIANASVVFKGPSLPESDAGADGRQIWPDCPWTMEATAATPSSSAATEGGGVAQAMPTAAAGRVASCTLSPAAAPPRAAA
jgi:glycosyltransferase involved in cell wall biosynthesis